MIDRNCDPAILSGVSDRRLASRVLDYARSTRERLGIRPTDFDLGSMLHHDIPFLASVAGAPMQSAERSDNPHLSGSHSRDRSIAEASRHVVRSTAFSSGMPDNCLLSDPVKGNAAALLVDRVARLAGVPRIDADGPRDALAAHMASAGVRRGRGMTTEWSPGWPDAEHDPLADVRGYSRRVFALDDRQLAAELLDHARDARTRLSIEDDGSSQSTVLWQTVPAMASLFGAKLDAGEGRRFELAVHDMNDQQAFGVASTLVASTLKEGAFLAEGATIGERSLFADIETGNTMIVLLDRTARALDVDRGGMDDPAGRAVASFRERRGMPIDVSWHPEDPARRIQNAMLIAHVASGIGS